MARVVAAYPGGAGSLAALRKLRADGQEIVTVTIDLGQDCDLDEVRAQALSAGALRAHVLDAREEFARDCLLPALRTQPLESLDPHALAAPLVQRKLAEIAAIENASVIDLRDSSVSPAVPALPMGPTLIERPVNDAARLRGTPAHVDLKMQGLLPVAVNGVPMTIGELLESLALIAGQHGIGRLPHIDAPAAPLLHAAYGALGGRDGTVRFQLHNGVLTTVSTDETSHELVNHT